MLFQPFFIVESGFLVVLNYSFGISILYFIYRKFDFFYVLEVENLFGVAGIHGIVSRVFQTFKCLDLAAGLLFYGFCSFLNLVVGST
jgi:hypothetical protein